MRPRFIIVDGADGSGKTTQVKLLRDELEKAGRKVYMTRLLGGTGDDWMQGEIRRILLDPRFPADSVLDEERLFGITDMRGLKLTRQWLEANPEGVAIQDRGLASHIVYAAAKDMTPMDIELVHSEVMHAYHEMVKDFGAVSVVMVPEDERMAMERVAARGETVTPRLENTETQRRVIEGMRKFHNYFNFTDEALIVARRQDSVEDVRLMLRRHPELYHTFGLLGL
jgi:dTMP kinase